MADRMAAILKYRCDPKLTSKTRAEGDTVLPVLNRALGAFLTISDAIGKILGLGKAIGWATVLAGAAAAGLIIVFMVGTLIPGLAMVIGLFTKMGEAARLAAAGQWAINAAMTANPLGITIVAIAGLIVVIYALEKKFGLVTTSWKSFSSSSIGKGIFAFIDDGKKRLEEIWISLNKAFEGGGMDGIMRCPRSRKPSVQDPDAPGLFPQEATDQFRFTEQAFPERSGSLAEDSRFLFMAA
jgi:hypothetical protein